MVKQIVKFILGYFVSDFAREDKLNALAEQVVTFRLPVWKVPGEIRRINKGAEL